MTEPKPVDHGKRRWVNVGEGVAVVGLLISGLALWNSWGRDDSKPPVIVDDQVRAIPLALRGRVEDGGKSLAIAPVEPGHALESLTLAVAGKSPLDLGSDPRLSASAVERLLADSKKEGPGAITVTLSARYIEAGTDRKSGGRYRLAYRWVSGGLLGGRSLRLTGLTRA